MELFIYYLMPFYGSFSEIDQKHVFLFVHTSFWIYAHMYETANKGVWNYKKLL